MNLNEVLKSVRIETPCPVLASNFAVLCSCGYTREYGYMHMTADRVADQHANKGHDVEVYEWDADPLPRVYMIKRLKVQKLRIVGTMAAGSRADSPSEQPRKANDHGPSERYQAEHQDPEASHLERTLYGLRRTRPDGQVPEDARHA